MKKATYIPALVAINQAPILGREQRRLTPYEAGRLQGFPDRVYEAMLATKQPEGQSYKQFGNAVHVGTVQFALVNFLCHHFGLEGAIDSQHSGATRAPGLGGLQSLVDRCRSIKRAWLEEGSDSETHATVAPAGADAVSADGTRDDPGVARGADRLVGVGSSSRDTGRVTGR